MSQDRRLVLASVILAGIASAVLAGERNGQVDAATAKVRVTAPPAVFNDKLSQSQKRALAKIKLDGQAVLRSKLATLDVKQFREVAPNKTLKLKKDIKLNLFSDAVWTAKLDKIESQAKNSWIGRGRLAEVKDSQVIIALRGDVLAANIRTPKKIYQVRSVGHGAYAVRELDPARFLPDKHVEPPKKSDSKSQPPPPPQEKKSGSGAVPPIIDLMVVYTGLAREQWGSSESLRAAIDLAIAETNLAYELSGITQRLRLVHTAELSYAESGSLRTDLERLTETSDGKMDQVHAWRDRYGADLVSLLVASGDSCGIGWQLTDENYQDFASYAFNIVGASTSCDNSVLAHELGHNMGANHDASTVVSTIAGGFRASGWGLTYDPQNSTKGAFPYSFGYQDPEREFRTIMAYNCQDGFCPVVPYFSTPNVTYNNQPLGNANADNARAINNMSAVVANFRASRSGSAQTAAAPAAPEYTVVTGETPARMVTVGSTTQDHFHSQGFVATHSFVKGVSFFMAKESGNPPFLITLQLNDRESSQAPLATAEITPGQVTAVSPQLGGSWVRINFSQPVPVTVGHGYNIQMWGLGEDDHLYYLLGVSNGNYSDGVYSAAGGSYRASDMTAKIHFVDR